MRQGALFLPMLSYRQKRLNFVSIYQQDQQIMLLEAPNS